MDCLVARLPSGSFSIDLFRKPSANSRFISWDSAHSFQHRVAMVQAFLFRISRLVDAQFVETNRSWLTKVATLNGMPLHVVHTQFAVFDRKQSAPPGFGVSPSPVLPRVCIPFHPGLTDMIRRMSRGVLEIVSRPRTLGSLFLGRLKFQTPAKFKPQPVYIAFCSTCDHRYYGESGASVYHRFCTGHWAALRGDRPHSSAIARHEIGNPGHTINPEVVVVRSEPRTSRRLLCEALLGRAENPAFSINREWEDACLPNPAGVKSGSRLVGWAWLRSTGLL